MTLSEGGCYNSPTMEKNAFIKALAARRSVRKYTSEPVSSSLLEGLIGVASQAPSGLNNQPWRFVPVSSKRVLAGLAGCTKYAHVIEGAPAAIAVFLDNTSVYHREKDIQAVGAAIENMLLAAHSLGYGTCWLGEILNRSEDVERLLDVPEGCELMAVITVGRPLPDMSHGKPSRKPLEEIIVNRFEAEGE